MEISFYKASTLFSNNQQLTFFFFENFELTFSVDHIPTHLKQIVITFWHKFEIFRLVLRNYMNNFK